MNNSRIQSANPRNAESYGWAVAIAIPLLIALMIAFAATVICQLIGDTWRTIRENFPPYSRVAPKNSADRQK